MTGLVFFVEQTAIALYILIGVGILIAWYRLVRSRAAYRGTYWELERDIARYQRANALTALILFIELALVVLGVQRVVAPTLRRRLSSRRSFSKSPAMGHSSRRRRFRSKAARRSTPAVCSSKKKTRPSKYWQRPR